MLVKLTSEAASDRRSELAEVVVRSCGPEQARWQAAEGKGLLLPPILVAYPPYTSLTRL